MATDPLKYPEPPEILRSGFNLKVLRYFGAGAILASVTIGSGETLMASRGGSIFGYALLWCVTIATLTKGVQVYTAARYFTLTGQHPLEHWARFPGPPKWIPAALTLLCLWCFPFLLAFLTLVLGEIINEMFHVAAPGDPEFRLWTRIWATLGAVIAISLTLAQSYGVLEKVQTTVIGLLLASIGAACLASNPDWIAALTSLFTPSVPSYQPWVVQDYAESFANRTPWVEVTAIVGFIGGGTYDYLGYVGCLREKGWGGIGVTNSASGEGERLVSIADGHENIYAGRLWMRPALIDVTASFACVFVFSVCFVILGAAVLHPQHLIPARNGELLTHQAQFLTRFHPSLLYIYQAGIFMAFWGTIYGAYEIYSRTLYECIRPLSSRLRSMPPRKVRLGVLVYCGVFGILLCWVTDNPIGLITFPSVVGGVLTCGLWCFGMIWLDRKNLPGPLQMGRPLLLATVLSGLLLSAMGFKALYDYFAALYEQYGLHLFE